MPRTKLLDLPAELRNQIYKHTFQRVFCTGIWAWEEDKWVLREPVRVLGLQLLLTNSQIYREARATAIKPLIFPFLELPEDVRMRMYKDCLWHNISESQNPRTVFQKLWNLVGVNCPYVRGDVITLKDLPDDTFIFHAGTKGPTVSKSHGDGQPALQPLSTHGAHSHAPPATRPSELLITSGGRVIAATSIADTLEAAISQAYKGISTIRFDNMHFRKDIGNRSLRDQLASKKLANGGGLTYASAGVSINSGNSLVKRIKPLVASTARPGASAEIGGFGGAFDLVEAGYTSPPILIEGTDGVGTKLKIAHAIGKHDTIGIDLVAMSVNDLVVQGAEPLTFMDTYSCSKLDIDIAEEVIKGVCAGCRDAGCALTGGETAEMPGLLDSASAYDMVGSATGAIEREKPILPDKGAMAVGDVLLGLASSGCHSNRFSLIRLIIKTVGLTFLDKAPWAEGETIGESLLTPTRIYVQPLLRVVKKKLVKGIAHITGGGLIDNIPRMLPRHLAAKANAAAWPVPKVLSWFTLEGKIEHYEFATTFNTGLGMVMVASQEHVNETMEELEKAGERVYNVGSVVEREGDGCMLRNVDAWDQECGHFAFTCIDRYLGLLPTIGVDCLTYVECLATPYELIQWENTGLLSEVKYLVRKDD